MDPREAELYGRRALALLAKARTTLGAKYGVKIDEPVTVEIFPAKKEFAVRTFGLPGAEGFLGVCFGKVITANSPASQGEHPTQLGVGPLARVLPRRHAGQDQKQDAPLAERGDLGLRGRAGQPRLAVGHRPPLPRDAPRARADAAEQAELGVPRPQVGVAPPVRLPRVGAGDRLPRRAVRPARAPERPGRPRDGETINEALKKRTGQTLDQLDEAFTTLRPRAGRGGRARGPPGRRSSCRPRPTPAPCRRSSRITPPTTRRSGGWRPSWSASGSGPRRRPRSTSWPSSTRTTSARQHLRAARRDRPPDQRPGGRAGRARGLGRPRRRCAGRLDPPGRDRRAGERLAAARRDARQLLAINPLIVAPHRWLAGAAEKLGQKDEAIGEYRAWATLDTTDPAEIHYRLAKLLAGERPAGGGQARGPEGPRSRPAVPRRAQTPARTGRTGRGQPDEPTDPAPRILRP